MNNEKPEPLDCMLSGIEGYPNYLVSSNGEIINRHGLKLSQQISHRGYMRVCLCESNHPKSHFVHRLVAKAFIPNPESKPEVNHKDGNRTNNDLSNLEWCTRQENVDHAVRAGTFNNLPVSVDQLTLDGEFIASFPSCNAASKATGVSKGNLYRCVKGTGETAGGYKWRMAE